MDFTTLIVDDEKEMCLSLQEILTRENLNTLFITDPTQVLPLLTQNDIKLIIMDIKISAASGLDLLVRVKSRYSEIPVIMITGYPSIENAVRSMKYGALNFFTKPLDIPALIKEITMVKNSQKHSKTAQPKDSSIIGEASSVQQVLYDIKKSAPTDVPVLINGETGTGKELVARELHRLSGRASRELLTINCASIPENLLESELFGHERGAFTDAKKEHRGIFERAHGKTIFLDEIGDMSPTLQPKILRVLQDGEVMRIGGKKPIKTDVRIISATNRNIEELIKNGFFRKDLYYRISVVTINMPPLRERRRDIPVLIAHFTNLFNEQYSKAIQGASEKAMEILMHHNWPGNIRELKNCIERSVIFAESNMITHSDLPAQYREIPDYSLDSARKVYNSLSRSRILDALSKSGGVKKDAAELLKVHRKTLYNRMKKLGLN